MPFKTGIKYIFFSLAAGMVTLAVNKLSSTSQPVSVAKQLRQDGLSFYRGIKLAYKNLVSYKKNEILYPGTALIILLILFVFDEEISNWFAEKGKRAPRFLKDFGWYFGSPENHFAITSGFYLYALFIHNDDVRKTGVLLLTATSAVGILQTILKMMIGRARPLRNEGKASFLPYSRENSYYSFPSGHSILSFTTAYSIGKQLHNPVTKTAIYMIGGIAPFSRLWARAHWLTDALTSLFISVRVVNSIDSYLKKDHTLNNG